ncbi:hypothetical protein D3C81_1661000 [compost metagenome]
MRLAVHRAQAVGVDHRRAVGQFISGQALAEAADDHQVQLTGQGLPKLQSRTINGFRQAQRLKAVGKQIAALHQFGQHDDLRALKGCLANRAFGERAVVGQVAYFRCQLAAGDHCVFSVVQRTVSADEWVMATMSLSLSASITRRSAARSIERLSR